MGNSLSDSKDLLIPFFGKFESDKFKVVENPVLRELRRQAWSVLFPGLFPIC